MDAKIGEKDMTVLINTMRIIDIKDQEALSKIAKKELKEKCNSKK